jgi:hypothetical protein
MEVMSFVFIEGRVIMFKFCPGKCEMAQLIHLICAFISDNWNALISFFSHIRCVYGLPWCWDLSLIGGMHCGFSDNLLWLWWTAFIVVLFLEFLHNPFNKLCVSSCTLVQLGRFRINSVTLNGTPCWTVTF